MCLCVVHFNIYMWVYMLNAKWWAKDIDANVNLRAITIDTADVWVKSTSEWVWMCARACVRVCNNTQYVCCICVCVSLCTRLVDLRQSAFYVQYYVLVPIQISICRFQQIASTNNKHANNQFVHHFINMISFMMWSNQIQLHEICYV